nr:14051_t:CDS:2 [Entrophospora candida]
MIRNEDISFIEYVDKNNMEKEMLFESLKFDRIYREETPEYGGYGYLINMNSVEFSIQEDIDTCRYLVGRSRFVKEWNKFLQYDSLNNYDYENELSDEMKSSNKTNNKRKVSSYLKDKKMTINQ